MTELTSFAGSVVIGVVIGFGIAMLLKAFYRLLMKRMTPDIHIRFMGDGTVEITKKKTDGTLDRSVIEKTGDEQK